ncbi:MAG TPA: hypothetical protein GXX75_02395 [Clostridiales bacterium]|nr:hypothetical protein [Clostridiales bacterium]
MVKKILLSALSIAAILGLTACGKLDVIGDGSIKSFDAVVNRLGGQVTEDTGFGGWSLTAPDGAASFLWSKDYSKTTSNDVQLAVKAQPFIAAGLDVDKLPQGILVGDELILGTELGDDAITYSGEATPLSSYEQIVKLYRYNISYHTALDHYGVELSGGNMFEWAKDMKTNDKDIVFVLAPDILIEAGVDPSKVDGWVFAQVETMDHSGKKVKVGKFLKPFDLDGQPEPSR